MTANNMQILQANELRIGNILYYQSFGNIIKLDADIMVSFLNDGFIDIHKFQPIPLTEEWLINLGFEKHASNPFWFKKEQFCISLAGVVEILTLDCIGARLNNEINYVHQLQNLFFALTNKELILKSK